MINKVDPTIFCIDKNVYKNGAKFNAEPVTREYSTRSDKMKSTTIITILFVAIVAVHAVDYLALDQEHLEDSQYAALYRLKRALNLQGNEIEERPKSTLFSRLKRAVSDLDSPGAETAQEIDATKEKPADKVRVLRRDEEGKVEETKNPKPSRKRRDGSEEKIDPIQKDEKQTIRFPRDTEQEENKQTKRCARDADEKKDAEKNDKQTIRSSRDAEEKKNPVEKDDQKTIRSSRDVEEKKDPIEKDDKQTIRSSRNAEEQKTKIEDSTTADEKKTLRLKRDEKDEKKDAEEDAKKTRFTRMNQGDDTKKQSADEKDEKKTFREGRATVDGDEKKTRITRDTEENKQYEHHDEHGKNH